MKVKQNAKMEAEGKGISINPWQSKNTNVFVPIRIYTDPLTKVLLIMQFASSLPSWLGSSSDATITMDTHPSLDMISSGKAWASYLTTDPLVSPLQLSRQLPYWLQNTVPAPGQQKVQAIKAKLAQKGKCPSTSLHSFPNSVQCKKTAKAVSRNCIYWPLPEKQAAGPTPWPPKLHACCPNVHTLTRRLGYGSDTEEICLPYSSLERSSCVFNMKHFIR